jgi:hypothetical protein
MTVWSTFCLSIFFHLNKQYQNIGCRYFKVSKVVWCRMFWAFKMSFNMFFFWFGNCLKNWPFFNSYGHPDIENSFKPSDGSKERGIWNIIRIVLLWKTLTGATTFSIMTLSIKGVYINTQHNNALPLHLMPCWVSHFIYLWRPFTSLDFFLELTPSCLSHSTTSVCVQNFFQRNFDFLFA